MTLTERILARVAELREITADNTVDELYVNARNHHLWAMGSRTNEEATEHEITADAYRLLAREKEEAQLPEKEFTVEITETLQRRVTVKAKTRREAKEKVKEQYANEEIVLGPEDFIDNNFEVIEEEK